jgi:ribosome-associated toxin RatA of RatAB toxin-antitoxin module
VAAEGVEGRATVHINAPPEKVYALVTDVSRMGEWSPECVRAEWVGGATVSFEALRYGALMKLISKPEKRTAKLTGDVQQTLERIKQAAEGAA